MPDFAAFDSEGNPIPKEIAEAIINVLGHKMLLQGHAHDDVADHINPTPAQYALEPNDLCILSHAGDEAEAIDTHKFDLVLLLHPEEFAEQFLDWETRLLNSFVLGRWWGEGLAPEGELGWFPRVKLLKVEDWQWQELSEHNEGIQQLDEPCVWLLELYNDTMAQLFEANPGRGMATPVVCEHCGRRTVQVVLIKSSRVEAIPGYFPESEDHAQDYHVISTVSEENKGQATLQCLACKTETEVDLDKHRFFFDG